MINNELKSNKIIKPTVLQKVKKANKVYSSLNLLYKIPRVIQKLLSQVLFYYSLVRVYVIS